MEKISDFFDDTRKQYAMAIGLLAGVITTIIVIWVAFTDFSNLSIELFFTLVGIVIIVIFIFGILSYFAIDAILTRKEYLNKLRKTFFENGGTLELKLKFQNIEDAPYQVQGLRNIYNMRDISKILGKYSIKNDSVSIDIETNQDVKLTSLVIIKLEKLDDFFELKAKK